MQLYSYEGTANVRLQFTDGLHAPRYIMFIIVSVINIAMSNNSKHSHVHFTQFFSVTRLDLVIQALSLDYILALGKKYAYASRASCFFYIEINIFEHS